MSPTKDELARMHWRERWEIEALQERKAMQALKEEALLDRIRQGNTGSYYQIWHVIAQKGTPAHSARVLWEYLQSHPGEYADLNRYHCAGALFQILGMPDPSSKGDLRPRVQWDHEGEEARQQALLELERIILEKIGS